MLGDVWRAYSCCAAALEIARAVDEWQMEGCTLTALGRMYVAQGERANAICAFEQALAILRAIGDRQHTRRCSPEARMGLS